MNKSLKRLTLVAMLTAMSVIIGIFCKNFLNFGGGLFRITFENLPIILAGAFFGPLSGAAVGAASDVISYFLSAQMYPPNLVVTVGAAVIGLVSGIASMFFKKIGKCGRAQIIVSASLAHIVGSMLIKSAGLYQFYGWLVVWRIPLYFVIAGVEIAVLCMLYGNSSFRRLIENY